jgi:hypothetical protein
MKATVLLALALHLGANSCQTVIAAEVSSAANKPPLKRATIPELQVRHQILNGPCCVPGIGETDYPVSMQQGHCKLPNSPEGDATISGVAFGVLNKIPVALATLSVWEGGSGQFHYLLLYELKNKKATQVGYYSIGDRTALTVPEIKEGSVIVTREQTIGQEQGKKETLSISREQFEALGCDKKTE